MGFLLAGFGKQMAGTRYRSLQARMMRVSSKLRRVTKDYERMKRFIDNQEKWAKNNINSVLAQTKQMAGVNLNNILKALGSNVDISKSQQYALAQSSYSTSVAAADMDAQKKLQAIEREYEEYRNNMLDPIKDEEDELSSEKESLESQITIAKQDYDACQKMEQSDAKMLAPNYTGAGQG